MKLRSTLPVRLLRSRHGDENDLRIIDAFLGAAGETQSLRGNIAVDDFLKARLVDRDFAGLQRFHFSRVVIDADDVMADVGETSAGHQTDVTGTDDGNIHGKMRRADQPLREKKRAKRPNCNRERQRLLGLLGAGRIEVQIKAEFRQGLQGEGEEDAIFLHAAVIANDRADRGDPAR